MAKANPTDEALLTTEQAAAVLGLKKGTLAVWRVRGGGPRFVRLSHRCVRYRRSDLDKWAAERVYRSTSEEGLDAGNRGQR